MKKIILIFMMLAGLTMNAQSKIEGVVTYYFNSNLGDKPDTGAKAILIDSLNIDSNFHNDFKRYTMTSFANKTIKDSDFYINEYSNLLKDYEGKKRHIEKYNDIKSKIEGLNKSKEDAQKVLIKYGINSTQDYENLTMKLYNLLSDIEDKYPSKTIDGAGKYSFEDINNGTYYILLKSKNRTFSSLLEIRGQLYLKKITFTEKTTKDVSNNFTIR